MRVMVLLSALCVSAAWAEQPVLKTAPVKAPTASHTIRPPSAPPTHRESHEHAGHAHSLPRLMPPPRTVGAEKTGDAAECLRSGGTGQRNERGQCMGWNGRPLP